MRVASYLLASASLVVVVTAAASRPYAPDLYARSDLLDDVEVVVSRSMAKAPYAPELYSRSDLHVDSFELKKRFLGEAAAPLQARHWACTRDAQCGSAGYCSTTKKRCFTKIDNGKKCSRDAACKSGFCSSRSDICKSRAQKNDYCECDGHCANGYDCVNKKCKSQPTKPSHPTKPDHPSKPKPQPSGSHQHPKRLEVVAA